MVQFECPEVRNHLVSFTYSVNSFLSGLVPARRVAALTRQTRDRAFLNREQNVIRRFGIFGFMEV